MGRRRKEQMKNGPDNDRDEALEKGEQTEAEVTAAQQEYIVLNRQEEESASSEKAERSLADYMTHSQYRYFDCDAIWKNMELTQAVIRKGEALNQENKVRLRSVESGYMSGKSETVGEAVGGGTEGKTNFPIHIVFDRDSVLFAECQCADCRKHYYSRYYRRDYCGYLAAFMTLVQDYLKEKSLGDATDVRGIKLIRAFSEQRANNVVSDTMGRNESLTLIPRMIMKNGDLAISFKVGERKLFVVKDLFEFYQNVQESKTAAYGSNTEFSHGIDNFMEKSRKWIEFIGRIVKEELAFERRMIEAHSYSKKAASKIGEFTLFGWRLDEFYRLVQGEEFEFEDRDSERKTKAQLRTGERNPRVSMTIRKNDFGVRRSFHGITVDCRMPQLFYGVGTAYYLCEDAFCRLEEEFQKKVRTVAQFCRDGSLTFQVGRNNLSQFYYSVLPQLEGVVDVMEENAEEIASYLPPEARFVFYLDAEEHNMTCRVAARYGETEFPVPDFAGEGQPKVPLESFRERIRESETMFLVSQWFPYWDADRQERHCGREEERMYQVLDKGVDALLSLGEVQCTRRFSNLNVGRRVRLAVGISVSRNLLNLNISTQDVPPEELLDILKSYRQKRKYYRLKNGDFLSLDEEGALQTLTEMVDILRMSPKELMKGNVRLPLYRALYLDKLLEKNQEIYSSRDSYFREMVKDFKTVNDADFEEPASLSGIMRGYQKNGYRWLRTLEEYRLGGILADDMGLGKTLQVLAVLLSAKLEGKKGTSLVIAPASLVFNWGEEIRSYTPELSYGFITGNQEERRGKLERYGEFDVLITSYDLLKRDIEYYEDKAFYYQIIDEGQYIKNHTTAAAKAVKAVKSSVRYALTGTPIENRLSELWSIFDFLIPGYLYGYDVFRNEFESPIVRNEDQSALKRLQRMTGPFILRRMKENVLKDLPEKLEENRYVRFEETQQKLYDAQVVHMKQKIVMQDAREFQKNKIQILAELTKLRQICCDPGLCFENYGGESAKLEACIDLVQSAVEGGHKILLFSQFTSMLEVIARRMEEEKISFYTITGATPKEKRLELVKAFNRDDTKVFLISLKAGGVGLNLTGADVVIHYDPWWNLAVQNQATDRTHRIGQTKVVVVYRLIAKGTIEERIQALQESKRALSDQIIQGDAGQLGGMTKEDFLSLL
ncbi:SNF2 family helicase [Acetatifactor muris]|nr:DEAD/DEAH box helicase [Acetatifactor muris]MCR2046919.1 SNF2 family helicase [Acetatifactor muris]